ncbi:hypothetical protein HDU97_009601 [Phlyctochytrium planicorne]|nr:hypothetical protein HDU97_009601 [Phlyctochytrium planicorne]
MILSIEELNEATDSTVIKTLEALFEPAPPLASALLKRRPFASWEELLDTTDSIIRSLSHEDKLVVINAHPRIGAPKTQLSAASLKEQGYTSKAPEVSAEDEKVNTLLQELNHEYEQKFGFNDQGAYEQFRCRGARNRA